jgi:hypothetical protein
VKCKKCKQPGHFEKTCKNPTPKYPDYVDEQPQEEQTPEQQQEQHTQEQQQEQHTQEEHTPSKIFSNPLVACFFSK